MSVCQYDAQGVYCIVIKGKLTQKKHLNEILDEGSPPGQLVGLLTDSLLTIGLLGFFGGAL